MEGGIDPGAHRFCCRVVGNVILLTVYRPRYEVLSSAGAADPRRSADGQISQYTGSVSPVK